MRFCSCPWPLAEDLLRSGHAAILFPQRQPIGAVAAGCVENELGLRQFLEERGHSFVVTADKEGENSEFDQHLTDADVVRAASHSVPSQVDA